MKATELRIGNYLKWKDNNQEFEITLSLFLSRDFWNHIKAGDILPIPLTKERLLKSGFLIDELKGFDRCNGVVIYSNNKIDISFEDKKFNLWFETDEDNWYNFKHIEIKQVHQLQNLYFALTRKELNEKTNSITNT